MSAALIAPGISRFYVFSKVNQSMRVSGAVIDKLWLIVAPLLNPVHDKSRVWAIYTGKMLYSGVRFLDEN